jgi:hypothetical protein
MRFTDSLFILILTAAALAQKPAAPEPKSVTVPITLDHNRVVIDVDIPLTDGSNRRIRAWVDNGNPELWMSRRVANLMRLTVDCAAPACVATGALPEIAIGGMKVSLASVKQAKIPIGSKQANSDQAQAVMIPGMTAEINIPSTILRNYAILVDFPGRDFTIGAPGSVKFNGMSGKIFVNPENGLVQIPSKVENRKFNLGLDMGASISFLAPDVFDSLAASHPQWPHMTGAIGPANMWGTSDEPGWKLLRLEHLQYGSQFLSDTAMARLSPEASADVAKRAGTSTAGLLGAEALLTDRVGIDYAHKLVYFEIGSTFKAPDFDVVGLTLRPEVDGHFTVIAIADFDGKPSVLQGQDGVQIGDHLVAVGDIPTAGSTLGQVWSMLRGTPGQERKLAIERNGKEFTVVAKVQHFFGEAAAENR